MMTIPSIDLNLGTDNLDAVCVGSAGMSLPAVIGAATAFQQAMAKPIAENAALGEAFAAAVAATVSESATDLDLTQTTDSTPAADSARSRRAAEPVKVAKPVDVAVAPMAAEAVVVATADVKRPDVAPVGVRIEQPIAAPIDSKLVAAPVADATPQHKTAEAVPVEIQVPVEAVVKPHDSGRAVVSVERPSVSVATEATVPPEKPVLDAASHEKPVADAASFMKPVLDAASSMKPDLGTASVKPDLDEESPVVAKPVHNLGEDEKADVLVASGVAPKVVPPGATVAPEVSAAQSITPTEVVRAQAAVSAVASAAPVAPTPAAVFVEAAQAVADTLLVSPGLLRGHGEIVVQLRPDVLEGTEVRIAVTGRQLDVQFRPTTVDMSVLLENGRTQIASHLSAKIATFNVTVDVRKKRV